MRLRFLTMLLVLTAIVGGLPDVALARIKLITLPVRQRVEIQLDNPNATLVEEERIVPLVKGVNQVDFSWANTQIDPNTILFRVLPRGADGDAVAGEKVVAAEQPEPLDVKVLSVSYPPNEAALVWQVSSSRFRLGQGADQLPAGQPHQELQLPGRGRRTTRRR